MGLKALESHFDDGPYFVYRLEDNEDEYGSDAGKMIVTTYDDKPEPDPCGTEVTGPMNEEDAELLMHALNALHFLQRNGTNPKFYGRVKAILKCTQSGAD